MLRIAFVAAAAVTLLAGSASAGGLSPGPYNWSGVYVGLGGGYGWGNTAVIPDVVPCCEGPNYPFDGNTLRPSGGFASFDLAVNKQINNTVFGIMADVSFGSIKASGGWDEDDSLDNPWNSETTLFATLRGRIGHSFGPVLPYVSAGLAVQDTNVLWTYENEEIAPDQHFHLNSLGWVVGAGVEMAIHDTWSLQAEYLYMNFGDLKESSIIFSDGGNFGGKIHSDLSVVKVTLKHKFGT